MTFRLDHVQQGVRELSLQRRYFDLIRTGAKTVEVRVAYPANTALAAGSLIRFVCDGDQFLVRVRRVTQHATLTALLDQEGASTVDPTASRADLLDAPWAIYPPRKEALGVLAIEIEPVDGPS